MSAREQAWETWLKEVATPRNWHADMIRAVRVGFDLGCDTYEALMAGSRDALRILDDASYDDGPARTAAKALLEHALAAPSPSKEDAPG